MPKYQYRPSLVYLSCRLDIGVHKRDFTVIIKTHDSESRGQEEAGRTRRMSVLFTGNTGVKFVNALNKPPLKLSLSYQGLSTF